MSLIAPTSSSLPKKPPLHETLAVQLDFPSCPDLDALSDSLTTAIHSSLSESVGQRKPRLPDNAWFWTDELQSAFDLRESMHNRWLSAPTPVDKCLRWADHLKSKEAFQKAMRRRRRFTWKQFCAKLATQPLSESSGAIKKIVRSRTISASFSHPDGPLAAANAMARHLRGTFAGDSLPANRQPNPLAPSGPHSLDDYPFNNLSGSLRTINNNPPTKGNSQQEQISKFKLS